MADDWQPPTEEEFNQRWLTPEEALEDLRGVYDSTSTAKRWIVSRLKAGLIVAVARTWEQGSRIAQFALVPNYMFNGFDEWGDEHFWNTGDAALYQRDHLFRFFDIRFDPETISSGPPKRRPIIRDLPAKNEASERTVNKGGRPRLEYWEPLLIEMFDQLWHGTLVPKTQADIEGAMHDWLSANGHSASERSVRQRAQSLWKVWTKEGNN